ncbi:hypothetical protein FKM82_017924 [Ascaphus truei]
MGLRLSLVLLVTSSGRAGGSWFRATSKMAPLLPGHSCDAYPGGGHFGRRLSPVRRCVRPLLFPAHRSLPAPAVHCGFPPSRAASPSCVGGRHHQKGGEVRYCSSRRRGGRDCGPGASIKNRYRQQSHLILLNE